MKKIVMVTGLVMGLAAMAMAKDEPTERNPMGPPPPHMRGGMMEEGMPIQRLMKDKDINLTKDQQQQIRAIVSGATNEMKTLHAKMMAVAKTQAELMGQDLPNEEAVLKGSDEIAQIRTDISRIRVKQMLAIQKIMTPEQRATMREKMKAQMAKRGMGERGKHKGHGKMKVEKDSDDKDPGKCPPPNGPQGE